jgi:hypothetical protein
VVITATSGFIVGLGPSGSEAFTADRSTEESSRASKTGGKAGVAGDRLRLGCRRLAVETD